MTATTREGKLMFGGPVISSVKRDIGRRGEYSNVEPRVAIVLVDPTAPSEGYVQMKMQDGSEVGIDFEVHRFSAEAQESEILHLIHGLNEDEDVDGIMVQLPLPEKFDADRIISVISPEKDVDGLHPLNVGRLWSAHRRSPSLVPCTARAAVVLLDHYKVELGGKHVVIVNRSNLVGKPLAKLLLDRDATVTICHSKTPNLSHHTQRADVLVSAVGKPRLIKASMVKEGAVVIDVGMSYVDGKLHGDVSPDVVEKASLVTPMPGGIGPATRAMLLQNVVLLAEQRRRE